MSKVHVRFAPSPTGYLHIGGARTALYNWLYAKKHGGTFVLRIEDTDAERSQVELAKAILEQLEWLGLNWDVGPNYQSENLERHKAASQKLLDEGKAYRCFCTKEELDAKREKARAEKADYKYDGTCRNLTPEEVQKNMDAGKPSVIRFKVPRDGSIVSFDDAIQGHNERSCDELEDFVIVRSNGLPLYLISNCVDDATDGITHVIRGQDGMANTPKQVLLYQALGYPVPQFGHMSLTLDMKSRKISKRVHGEAVSVGFFRDHGFLPWALCNALVLLGWSPGDDREFFTRQELIEAFELSGCTKTNSKFALVEAAKITEGLRDWTDPKALHINATYIRTLPIDELLPYVRPLMEAAGLWDSAYEGEKAAWLSETLDLIRERYFTLNDFVTLGRSFFTDEYPFEAKAVRKNLLKNPDTFAYLGKLADIYEALDDWELESLEAKLRELCEELEVKAGLLINGARAALTGMAVGPSMFHVMTTLGKEKTIRRLREVESKVEK